MSKVELELQEYELLKTTITELKREKEKLNEELTRKKEFIRQFLGKIPSGLQEYFIDNIIDGSTKIEINENFKPFNYRVIIGFEVRK